MDECVNYVHVLTLMLRLTCIVSRFRILCFYEFSSTHLVGVKWLNYKAWVCSSLLDNAKRFSTVVVK